MPEASAVEGRIYREEAFDRRRNSFLSIAPSGKVAGCSLRLMSDSQSSTKTKGEFAQAVAEYRKALAQLSDSEPVIYQMLGAAYERMEKPKEAVAAYEKYLAASAKRQLRRSDSLHPRTTQTRSRRRADHSLTHLESQPLRLRVLQCKLTLEL